MIVRDPHSDRVPTDDEDVCVVLCGGNVVTHATRLCSQRTHMQSVTDEDPPWWASFRVVRTYKEGPCC